MGCRFGRCWTGLTLKRCNQLTLFAIQPVGWAEAAVLLVDDGAHQVCYFRALNGTALEVVARERQMPLSRKA